MVKYGNIILGDIDMYDYAFLFMLFFGFSVFGWILECVSCSIWYHKFVHDRGFLLGPYCPIYGVGALGGYFILSHYADEPFTLFIMAAVGSTVIEYITSYIMEKIFNARWWDYSDRHFNIEGRVCLRNSFLFGVMGLGFVYFVKPFYENITDKIDSNTLIITSIVCSIIFVIDFIVSFILMNKIKKKIVAIKKDRTSDIEKATKEIFKNYKFSLTKLFNSFPGIKFNIPSGEQIVLSIINTLNSSIEPKKEKLKKLTKKKKKNK